MHYVKIVGIRSFSGPYFPAFGLNTERYSLSLRIQSKCGKIRTTKTPNTVLTLQGNNTLGWELLRGGGVYSIPKSSQQVL